jgi:KDO2-lipid IV(A) lauroyltransferase
LAVYEHHARTIIEILRMDEAWIARHCTAQGLDHLLEWRRANPGRGFLIVGGHIGNFEVLVGFGKSIGIESAMIARPLENPYFERLLQSRRRRYGLVSVPRARAMPRELLLRLRQGQGIGLAIDQNAARGGVFVNVLGVPAATARGAAVLALRENAAAFIISSHRLDDGRHRIVFGPPIEPVSTGDFERDVVIHTQRFSREFEQRILMHPEQYHWQHPRWRTRPDGSDWQATDPEGPLGSRTEPFFLPPARFRQDDRRTNPQTALEHFR